MNYGKIVIRHEKPAEYRQMENLVREAFWDVYRPGCDEHLLTHRLRTSPVFLPYFTFAAEYGGVLAGGIFYAAGSIVRKDGSSPLIATFGPLAVLPEFQGRGIGTALIQHTVPLVRAAGYDGIVIYGNPAYYSRFGFEPGEKYGIAGADGEFCDALQILPFRPENDLSGRFDEGEIYRLSPADSSEFDRDFPPKTKHVKAGQLCLGAGVIRPVAEDDFEAVYEIVNDAAQAYRGIIPADRWHEPYMPREELRNEINDGVMFFGYEVCGILAGVMGLQDKGEVDLIRHAYVRTACRSCGIGGKLLEFLRRRSGKPILVGTWADASWAVRFYEKNGFRLIEDREHTNALLRRYWNIPARQVETSVVLTDEKQQ